MPEAEISAERLAEQLNTFLDTPGSLTQAAMGAHDLGRPTAGAALADLVESLLPVAQGEAA